MIRTLKIKITNFCMNNCCFCIFHKRTHQLAIAHVKKILAAIPKTWRGQILINGGEPTLHKNFVQISEIIRNEFPKNRFGLGTNLKLFEKKTNKIRDIYDMAVKTYDLFQIGCDLEHRNIEIVERLVPIIRKHEKDVYINCITEYSNEDINHKLKILDKNYGSKTNFSPVHNHFEKDTIDNKVGNELCKKRQREILIDADGEIYFCFKQSFEKSLGNVKDMSVSDIHKIFFETEINYFYNACIKCPYYE